VETDEIDTEALYGMLVICNLLIRIKGSVIFQKEKWKGNIVSWCEKFLASIRSIDGKDFSSEEYRTAILCSYQASQFLKDATDPLWRVMKPLYLAFRKSKKVWVRDDLSFPQWYHDNLFWNLVAVFVFFDEYDDALRSLRQDFANYLADLLKPLPATKRNPERIKQFSNEESKRPGFDIYCTEPDPIWRYCIIRAMVDLGVSVDGKGHFFFSVLKNVAEQDKAPEVREVAKKVITKMETIRNGWLEGNHHRHLLMALWWIRLAHVKTLEAPFDLDKAKKLRVVEYRNIEKEGQEENLEIPDFVI
jgi:hypothetical protein